MGGLLISKQDQRSEKAKLKPKGSYTFTGLTPSPYEGRRAVKESKGNAKGAQTQVLHKQIYKSML